MEKMRSIDGGDIMDAMGILENSYHIINRNFSFYKKNYGHTYYLNVKDDETKFIDKMFGIVENALSAQDKMLNYSISAIYTATAVLLEVLRRSGIEYTEEQSEKICIGFSSMKIDEVSLVDKSEAELDEILFGLLTDGIDLQSRKKSGSERTPDEIIKYMLDMVEYDKNTSVHRSIVDPACRTGTFIKQIMDRFMDGLYKDGITNETKEKLLVQKLIRAYDTKPSNVFVTKIVMISAIVKNNLISEMNDILEMMDKLPVYCQDFLEVEEKADYIIGNPPYIRLQNMSIEYRERVKKICKCYGKIRHIYMFYGEMR
jgi:type I restriction-modification system DNA methylase subunit